MARALIPAELGAEFIHGRAPETMALLREIGSAAIDTGGEDWTYENGDLRLSGEDDFLDAARLFTHAASLPNDESVDRFLRRFENDASQRKGVLAARAFAEGFDAADPAIASARSIGDEWQSGVDSSSARPLGGYGPIIRHLHDTCEKAGVTTYLSAPVRKIAWRPGDVVVAVQADGAEARTIRARAAIVTLPVGVLRHAGDEREVVFDPPLSPPKRRALENVTMGAVVRVVLSFRTAFWESVCDGRYRDAAFFRSTEHPFATYWAQLPVRSELIVAWVGGPKARALGTLSEEEIIERALDGFGGMLDERARARSEFDGAVMHDWNRDPHALGAYSYVAVNGGDARAGLAEPIDDTLFFAGEATSGDGQGGTVNGALETGERAARQAAASLAAGSR